MGSHAPTSYQNVSLNCFRGAVATTTVRIMVGGEAEYFEFLNAGVPRHGRELADGV
jgi:hypothetical protein